MSSEEAAGGATYGSTMVAVNARIAELAPSMDGGSDRWDFFCECSRGRCDARVSLTLAEYEHLRELGKVVLADGHQVSRDELARRAAEALCESASALQAQASQQNKRARRNRRARN